MIEGQTQAQNDFCVVCIWCGLSIRRESTENSYGICLQCFYRILSEQLRVQTRSSVNQFASER
jgi:hypothetical protein